LKACNFFLRLNSIRKTITQTKDQPVISCGLLRDRAA
jgi:hypothetical protein